MSQHFLQKLPASILGSLAPKLQLFRISRYLPLCEPVVPISCNPFHSAAAMLLLAAVGLFQQALAADAAVPSARYSGSATLATLLAASSNRRFQLDAQLGLALSASAQASSDGRFALSAKLKPDPNSVTGTCAPQGNSIFFNGFE